MLHPLTQKIKTIKHSLKKSLEDGCNPIAAFDADGTLWRCDVGELFFEYQIQNRLVELPRDPWGHYRSLLKDFNDGRGYLWLAQINSGVEDAKVKKWASECLKNQVDFPIFEEQREIISFLQSEKVEIFVVSASIKWAVEPAALLLGIPSDHVLAIQTEIANGIATDKQFGALTWKDGKVKALSYATQGKAPFFCSGNSEGDFQLLEYSSHHQLVIASAVVDERNYRSEQKMLKTAGERGWWSLDYNALKG